MQTIKMHGGIAVDNLKLIQEVRGRQELYDKSMKDASHIELRKNHWKSVTEAVLSHQWNRLNAAQKEKAVNLIHKRWNNLRSAFVREFRNQQRAETDPSIHKRRKYIYHDQMSFLINQLEYRETHSNSDAQDHESQDMEDDEDEDPMPECEYEENEMITNTVTIVKSERPDDYNENYLEEPRLRGREIDQDEHFVKSLIPMFKKLPLSQKLTIQIGILKLFRQTTDNGGCN